MGMSDLPDMNRQGPAGAHFNLPAPDATVDLDGYRNAFNKWNRTGGHTRARNAGSETVDVTIEAYPWAHSQGPRHVPEAGDAVLVGRLVNMGSATTDMYSLTPGAEYYLFATNVNGATGWEMREVGSGSSGTMPIRASGLYNSCGHSPASKSEADFKDCTMAAASHHDLRLASSSGFAALIESWLAAKPKLRDDPAWISCDGGCCTLTGA